MKKIVQLITFLNDAGAENLIKNYCLNIDRRKFEMVVVTIFEFHTDCTVYRSIQKSGIQILSVYDQRWKTNALTERLSQWGKKHPSRLISRIWNRLLSDRVQQFLQNRFEKKTGCKLGKLLRFLKPDVIHAHLHVQNYMRYARWDNNIRVYYTCHSEPYRYFSGVEYKNTEYLINRRGMRLIALHDEMRKTINSLFGKNDTLLLENWIDFSRFRSVYEAQDSIQEELGIFRGTFVLGTVGRIVVYKNQIFLVNVLKKIIDRGISAVLVIVGTGDEEIKKQIVNRAIDYGIEKNVLFLGVRSDVERIYKAMDVFALPSLFEGMSLVGIEAQVSGKKCLFSDRIPKAMNMSEKSFFCLSKMLNFGQIMQLIIKFAIQTFLTLMRLIFLKG